MRLLREGWRAGRRGGCASLLLFAASLGAGTPARGSEDGARAPEGCGSIEGIEVGPRLRSWVERRRAKCARITPDRVSFLERQILAYEKAERPPLAERDLFGFYPRFQTIDHRSQVAGGLRFWKPDLGRTPLDASGNAFFSLRGFRYFDAQVGLLPHAGKSFPPFLVKTDDVFELARSRFGPQMRFALFAAAAHRYAPAFDFFGIGPDSKKEDRADFLQEDTVYEGVGGYRLGPLTLAARAGHYEVTLGQGTDEHLPDLTEVFPPASLPGYDTKPQGFARYGASFALDGRDVPDNPHAGAFLGGAWMRYDARDATASSFDRFAVDARLFLSLGHRQRVLALRAYGSHDSPRDPEGRVPFYLLAVLGNSHTLRAFESQRFRGEKLFALQAEYRWEASPAIELAAFWDGGAVAARAEDDFGELVTDLGVGLRLKTHEATQLRADLAWGEEGTRILLRFSCAY